MKTEKIILGIDPGTLICGIGIISTNNFEKKLIYFDTVINKSSTEMPLRLSNIYKKLNSVIKKFKPNEVALETAFYSKNAQSALKIGQVRGVAMLVAELNNLKLTEYSPREIKKSVVGTGSATKEQVQFMTMKILKLNTKPKYFDETDALAICICHANKNFKFKNKFASWKNFIELNPDRIKKIK